MQDQINILINNSGENNKKSKCAGPNKSAGCKIFQKLINVQDQIRACRLEKIQKINKRACTFIRYLRVHKLKNYSLYG